VTVRRFALFVVFAGAAVFSVSCAGRKTGEEAQTKQREVPGRDRLQWFREARFGMFIHWGLYAVPAGEWNGKTDYGEWIQFSANIPGPEYVKLAAKFNPVKFNAREWVTAAKDAGMKYLVITAKHHEGFAMYDSKLTDYDIVDATPYKRDPMKELAAECARQGVRFCFYYSVKDWRHPEYPTLYTRRTKDHPDGFHGFPKADADFMKYLDYMQGQLRELMTNYGPIGTLFFDWYGDAFEDERERKRGQEIVDMIHKLQPDILINNRLAGIGADYGTPEQEIPGGREAKPFEVCMTLNRHWGYNKNDHDWKDARTIVFNLCDIASKGGNYLLNVGPTAEGEFPAESVRILREVGRWLKVNGEAVYGANPGPSMRWEEDIDMMTTRPGTYYLHVFKWPKDRKLFYFDFRHRLKKAYLLADASRTALPVDTYRRSLMIHLPKDAPDPINSVVAIEYE
jgi:alpha-L-fucosidase